MAGLSDLSGRVRQSRRHLDQLRGRAKAHGERGLEVQREVAELSSQAQLLERTAALLAQLGEQRQTTAQLQIEGLVTRGLQTIFGEDLSFHVVQSVRGRQAHTDFVVRSTLSDGTQVDTPVMEARGGGLAATVGFLLRLVVMLLSGQRDTLLVLDETFAMVSDEYTGRLAEFLREVVDKTGVQVLMVTHQAAFTEPADKVYRFTLRDGKTQVLQEA